MELRHIRYFVMLAEELHFGRAAARLHISQPPLSQQIQALEAELGVPLFIRGKKQVALSEAGKAFLKEARELLYRAARSVKIAQRAGHGETGMLHIGYTGAIAYTRLMSETIRRFHQDYPDVTLSLQEAHSRLQVLDILEGKLDIGFVRSAPDPDAASLVYSPLLKENLVVALPASHRFAKLQCMSIRKLKDEPFIFYADNLGTKMRPEITQLCLQAGFIPNVTQEASEMATMIALVGTGLGVSIVTEAMCQLSLANVVYIPLKEKNAQTQVMLAWRSDNQSPVLHNFRALAGKIASLPDTHSGIYTNPTER